MLSGLISGNILHIHHLCSSTQDIHTKALQLHPMWIHKINPQSTILTRHKSALNYLNYTTADHNKCPPQNNAVSKQKVFLHLFYHLQDPWAKDIQHIWKQTITNPSWQPHISDMISHKDAQVPFIDLTIAYSHSHNLHNQFSIWTILYCGQETSTFLP